MTLSSVGRAARASGPRALRGSATSTRFRNVPSEHAHDLKASSGLGVENCISRALADWGGRKLHQSYFYRSFAHQVVPAATKAGIAPLGMKSLGGGSDHQGRLVTAKICTVEE